MSKLPFTHHLQSEYTLGKDLNLLPFELFNHVKAGRLHPFDKDTGRLIPRPDAMRIWKKMKGLKYTHEFLPLLQMPHENILKISEGLIKQARLKNQREINGTQDEYLILTYSQKYQSLNREFDAITDFCDWTTYDTPVDPRPDFAILQNALFHNNEIRSLNIEKPLPAQEEPVSVPPGKAVSVEESAPAPVNEVVFSYVSPTEVMVKCGNKRAASHDQLSLGFKKVKNPKAWNSFLEILKSGNPSFSFGKSGTKYNDNSRKMFEFINDKLVVFLNTKMKMHLPQDFKLYEKDKTAGTGIYKFNFRIGKYNTNSIGVEDLPDDKLMADIKKCLTEQEKLNRTRRGDKAAENQSEEIRERIIPLLTEAHTRKLIDDKCMHTYLNQLNPPEHD